MFLSMGVDFWRSRALTRIASKYDSQALEADALHFSTDIWSSGVVILGLLLVWLGRTLKVHWLRDADPIAALLVAGLVFYVSSRLARKTIDALLDAAPAGVRSQIIDEVSTIGGVLELDRVRIRRAGNRYFADLLIGLGATSRFNAPSRSPARSPMPFTASCPMLTWWSGRCRSARARKTFSTAFARWPRAII